MAPKVSRSSRKRNGSSRSSGTGQRQHAALKQVDQLAWLLDSSIRIPGLNYRIGLDPLIGLIPGLGDMAGTILSSYIVLQAVRLGAPRAILTRMVLNIGIEAAVGLVPVLGDIFDATFKANVRNVQLLNGLLNGLPANQTLKPIVSRGVIVGIVAALLAILVLVSWVGVMLIWWLVSLIGN